MSFKKILFVFLILNSQFLILNCNAQRYELSKKDTSEVKWINGKKFYLIKVEKGETMYSLSKRFSVSQDSLVTYNPDLKFGLQLKMKLQIPSPHHEVAVVKSKAPEPLAVKSSYNVALMLPLSLWKNFLTEFTIVDSSGEQIVLPETVPQLEFYEGALKAADSLASKNFKLHIEVFDTGNDTSRVSMQLKDPVLKQCDFIIVSGNPNILNQVNKFSEQQGIKLLSYSFNASDLMKNNPNAYAFIPSSNLQCVEAGKFFGKKFKDANLLIVKSSSSKESERASSFITGWSESSEIKAKTLDGSQNIYASLSKTKNNIVFVPSSNEDFVSSVAVKLNDTISTYKITLIGIPTWQYFETIDPVIFQNLDTHIFTSSMVLLNEKKAVPFIEGYTDEYLRTPSDAAFEGFDAITFISHLHSMKVNTEQALHFDGLYSSYDFAKNNGTNENHHIYYLRYNNFELVEVK